MTPSLSLRTVFRFLMGLALSAVLLQAGCAAFSTRGEPPPTVAELATATETSRPPTTTREPTETPEPTDTEEPTHTPRLTDPPEPTRTPRAVATQDPQAIRDRRATLVAATDRPTEIPGAQTVTPTRTPQPTGTEEAPDIEPVELEVCDLLTGEEVAEALGASSELEPMPGEGNCTYMDQNSAEFLSLTLSAAWGDEAKLLLIYSIASLMAINDPSIDPEEAVEDLQEQAEDMSLGELYQLAIPLYEEAGFEVSEVDDLGDEAYWLWYADEAGANLRFGELFVLREDAYLMLGIIGLDEDEAQDATAALAEIALDRLPPAFDVLPEDFGTLTP